MTKVFLSVSHKDIGFAERLYSDLWGRGIDVWLFTHQPPGNLITRQIDSELNGADFFCPICSEAYFSSAFCQEELAMARFLSNSAADARLKAIVPLVVGSCDLPLSLRARVWLDFRTDDYSHNFDQLVKAMEADLALEPRSIRTDIVSPTKDFLQSEILDFVHTEQIVDFEEEIDIFRRMLAPGGRPAILFVQAPSGMGKTWLLYRFLHVCHSKGLRTSYIDFRGGFFRHPQAVIDGIVSQVGVGWKGMSVYELRGALRRLSAIEEDKHVVFLFDTVEEAQEVEPWLVENVLAPIRDGRLQNLRLVAAGLRNLRLAHEEEWLGIVEQRYGLSFWQVEHIQHFAQANGLDIDQDKALLIHQGTRGFPQICAVFVRNLLQD